MQIAVMAPIGMRRAGRQGDCGLSGYYYMAETHEGIHNPVGQLGRYASSRH